MLYNPGDGSGVIDEINDICATDDVTYPIEAKTRRVNQALDEFVSIALMYDPTWSFDDLNNNDLPIGTTDLFNGQQDYLFAEDFLVVRSVFAKDQDGVYHELEQETDPENTLLVPAGNYGVPTKYRIIGGSILLDFIPNYDSTDGLKVFFGRGAYYMAIDDQSRALGIPLIFHEWVCQRASLPYLIQNRLPNKNDITALIAEKKNPNNIDSIPYFYSNRVKKLARIVASKQDNK